MHRKEGECKLFSICAKEHQIRGSHVLAETVGTSLVMQGIWKYGATNQCFQHPCIHRAYPGDADHEHVNLKKEKPAMPHGFRSLE